MFLDHTYKTLLQDTGKNSKLLMSKLSAVIEFNEFVTFSNCQERKNVFFLAVLAFGSVYKSKELMDHQATILSFPYLCGSRYLSSVNL